jgi:hypothetical protein
MRTGRVIFFVVLILLACSCTKVIEPKDLPDQDPRLVMNAIIQSDSVFSLQLSSSKSIVSGKDYKKIEGAYCEVQEDGSFLEQLFMKEKGRYVGKLKPQAGKTYKMVAKAPGYQDVEGTSMMPGTPIVKRVERVDSATVDLQTQNMPEPTIVGNVKYKVSIKDPPDEKNYYGLMANYRIYDTSGTFMRSNDIFITVDISDDDVSNASSGLLLGADNRLLNGDERVFSLSFFVSVLKSDFPSIGKIEMYLSAAGISEDFYKYVQTATKQSYSGTSVFSEPVLVYNNIKNGMGNVGCVNVGTPRLIYSRNFKK